MDEKYYISIDLGQAADFTAIVCLEQFTRYNNKSKKEIRYNLRYVEKLPLGTTYPTVVEKSKQVIEKVGNDKTTLVMDATGVGRPVFDMFKEAKLSKRQENPIFTRESAAVIMSRNKEVHGDEQKEAGISHKGIQLLEGAHRSMAGKWEDTGRVLSAV
ncbi:MAG: hypothetical protein HQL06_10185 [Nitrospirae bacterium]|nr:hypothetical protein [Nitrospirota bacterium]